MAGDNGKTLTILIFIGSFVGLVLGVWLIRRWAKSGAIERELESGLKRPHHERRTRAQTADRHPQIRVPPPAYHGGFVNDPYYWR
ncbi:hypothetical protein H2200_006017 [Cladophialophora chaetospira]|uniref:Uncharacterized protein n=1 Tax=Cladophialophora chaetospira TaxID=386627 RepID=A0AA39CIQ8_9EURO|nr:hypothetical protein H2200_006017 [Cladophialophora chaetospira]